MALKKGQLAGEMKSFMKEVNKMKQDDADKAIDRYCKHLEKIVYDAIKSITIVIPTAAIQVQGTSVAQSNINPIVLKDVVN